MTDTKLCLKSYQPTSHTHQHDFHQLVLPVKGNLDIEIENRSGIVNNQQAAVIYANNDHAFEAQGDNQFIVADIPITLAPAFDKLPVFLTLDDSLKRYIHFLQSQLHSDNNHSDALRTNPVMQRQMLVLLVQLLDEKHADHQIIDRRIESARHYLERHYAQKDVLTKAANFAAISARHMRQLFAQYYSISPSQFLLELRMQAAWQLLSSSQHSIEYIAHATGYSTISAFSDRFTKHYACSANQVRRLSK